MFRRKLDALGYERAEDFNVCSQNDFRNLVVWLEDQKIRNYPIDDRVNLRDIESPTWDNSFHCYLDGLAFIGVRNNQKVVCDWLLSLAIRLEYADNLQQIQAVEAERELIINNNMPPASKANPLDNLDFESNDFKNGVRSLAKLLKINLHPDHLVTLRAITEVVAKYYSSEGQQELEKQVKRGKPFPIKESHLGFETNDPVLNEAVKILRLLYIHDLRNLQTKINEAIVAVQTITANPKTDTRLGKVGR